MKYRSECDNLHKHLYTVPWSFEHLHTSMLANDDTSSVCSNVQYLTLDMPCTNISHRFPNIHTLNILPECNLSQDDYIEFRQLRHLIMNNINIVPSSVIRHIHTITLFDTIELLTHSIIYSNVKHFILKNIQIDSLETITALIKHFPNLRFLEIQFQQNVEYYDSLDMLVNGEHLPHLLVLKTNWIDNGRYRTNINLWIAANTSLRWRTTLYYGHRDDDKLTVCL